MNRRFVDIGFIIFVIPLVPLMMERRGLGWTVLGVLTYSTIGLANLLSPKDVTAWSARHKWLDRMFLAPLVMVGLAYLTNWPSWICVAFGLVAGAVLFAALALGGNKSKRNELRA